MCQARPQSLAILSSSSPQIKKNRDVLSWVYLKAISSPPSPSPGPLEASLTENRRTRTVKLTYHDEAHLAHSLLMVIVHLAHQCIAQMHSNTLDRLILTGRAEDAKQQLIYPAVLELQFLRDAEVAEGQTAVPLHLGQVGRQAEHVQG